MTLTATVPFDADEMTTYEQIARTLYDGPLDNLAGVPNTKLSTNDRRYYIADDGCDGSGMYHDYGLYCECSDCLGE